MSFRFFKPVKKYVSRSIVVEKMKITQKQFDRIIVLCSVYPVVAENKHSIGKEGDWFYKIDDIKKMFYSEVYEICNKNLKKEERRKALIKVQQFARADRIKDTEISFVNLVKQKYPFFANSLEDLGSSVRNLYFIKLLEIDDANEDVNYFESFIIKHGLLNWGFMSKKGVYFAFTIENLIISWLVPYPGLGLSELVEDKCDIPDTKKSHNFDFLDFGFLSDEEEEDVVADQNNPEKFDISLLKYSSPLIKTHIKLVLFKLEKLLSSDSKIEKRIFLNKKVFITVNSIKEHLEFAIKCGGGEIVYDDADFIIGESVDKLEENKIYLQPQYIFDSLNQSKLLPFDNYLVGKICPPHISPFPNVLDLIDERAVKLLSNKKKYDILDRVEDLN